MLKLPRKAAVALTVAAVSVSMPVAVLAQQQGQPGQQQQQQQPQQQQQQQPQQQQGPQIQATTNPARTVAGLTDVAAANFLVLNQGLADQSLLSNLVNERAQSGVMAQQGQQMQQGQAGGAQLGQQAQQTRIVHLARGMDSNAQNQLLQALRSSDFLQRNAMVAQQAIRSNQALGQALQRNNIPVNQVVALDVLGSRDTIYVMTAGPSQLFPQGQQQQQQPQQQQQQQPQQQPQQQRPQG